MNDWSLTPIFDSYLLVAILVAGLGLCLLIGPNFGQLSRGRRLLLAALRLASLAVVTVALLRPTWVHTVTKTDRATLLVLADRSRSMRQPHATGPQTRWQAQSAALSACQEALAEIGPHLEVRGWTYAGDLQSLTTEDGIELPVSQVPDGDTDIGSALHDAVRSQLGKRLAGVVLLGDGVQTVPAPRMELYEAAREIARLGYPLYTVVFGPAGAAGQARDVAVESLPDQFTVFAQHELQIRGLVRVRGYVNQEIPVELVLTDEAGQAQVLGTRRVIVPEDGAQVDVTFPYVPPTPGTFRLTLRAAAQPGELVTQNNELGAYLHVLEGGLKVLYLEGELRHEQRFLMRTLDASPDIDLEFQWIDGRRRDRWPVDLSAVLDKPTYDVLILGDLDATALGAKNAARITASVRQGRGLLLLGGYHSFGAGGYSEVPLADIIPLQMDKLERQAFDEPWRADLHLPGPLTVVPARPHPLTQLSTGVDNPARWRSLPPLDGANKFTRVKDAAGVQVVLETTAGAPILVVGEADAGRVVACAADSTWKWRMRGRGDDHRRFWRQVILWLARREDQQRHDVWVRLPQRRLAKGARSTWTAGVRAPTGEPLPQAQLTVELTGPDGQRTALRATQDRDQWSGTAGPFDLPGEYRLVARATVNGLAVGEARGEFLVFDQDLELATPAADRDQLARLADITREQGGRLVPAEQLPALLREIAAASSEFKVETQTTWRLTDTALDTWLLFLSLLTLWGSEWFLRRRWGLY